MYGNRGVFLKNILYCWAVACTFDTHTKYGNVFCIDHEAGKVLKKRAWGRERQLRYPMWILKLVFEVFTVTPAVTSLWYCMRTAVHHRASSSPGGSICRAVVLYGAVLRLCMPAYWPKHREAQELVWIRKECSELDYGFAHVLPLWFCDGSHECPQTSSILQLKYISGK